MNKLLKFLWRGRKHAKDREVRPHLPCFRPRQRISKNLSISKCLANGLIPALSHTASVYLLSYTQHLRFSCSFSLFSNKDNAPDLTLKTKHGWVRKLKRDVYPVNKTVSHSLWQQNSKIFSKNRIFPQIVIEIFKDTFGLAQLIRMEFTIGTNYSTRFQWTRRSALIFAHFNEKNW